MLPVHDITAHNTRITGLRDGQEVGFLQTSTNRYMLSVPVGQRFGFRIANLAYAVRAYPTVLVGRDNIVRNVFLANELTDPNLFPSDGGMLEADAVGTGRNTFSLNGFLLPNKQKREFKFVPEGEGADANIFRIYVRTPVDPELTFDKLEHLRRAKSGSRSAGGDVGGGEIVIDGRELTHVQYNPDAVLVAEIVVVSPSQSADAYACRPPRAAERTS